MSEVEAESTVTCLTAVCDNGIRVSFRMEGRIYKEAREQINTGSFTSLCPMPGKPQHSHDFKVITEEAYEALNADDEDPEEDA